MKCGDLNPHPPHSFLFEGRIGAACPGVPEPPKDPEK